jgi:hypothetical protein
MLLGTRAGFRFLGSLMRFEFIYSYTEAGVAPADPLQSH